MTAARLGTDGQLMLAAMPSAGRVSTRELVTIGQRWRRRRDGAVWLVYQVHRADRLVEVVPLGEGDGQASRLLVPFRDLRRKWTLVSRGRS